VWDVILRGGNQLRISNKGVILGFDIAALAAISAALGYDTGALLQLFHHAECGLLQAIKDHGDHHHEKRFDPPVGDRGG
jgi:hypothetical protein